MSLTICHTISGEKLKYNFDVYLHEKISFLYLTAILNLYDPSRISDYLNLCLTDDFKNLVNISSISWYILMLGTNLIYYVMGIIYARTKNESIIENALSAIYLGYSVVFVIVSCVVFIKMKQVFYKIVKDETWIQDAIKRSQSLSGRNEQIENQDDTINRLNVSSHGRNVSMTHSTVEGHLNQHGYFWGNDPSVILNIAQLGQFGL